MDCFFCHLVIEKAIKAHYVKITKEVAPNDETQMFIGILMKYQLQGRYPDYSPIIPDQIRVNEYIKKTIELLQWLKMKL